LLAFENYGRSREERDLTDHEGEKRMFFLDPSLGPFPKRIVDFRFEIFNQKF